MCAGDEVRGDGAGLENGREGELVARHGQRPHLPEGLEGVAAEAVVGEGGDEGGPGAMVLVGEVLEELPGGLRGAASGVERE